MKNKVFEGDTITIAAPVGGVVSGQGVLIGTILGVAVTSADAGESVACELEGVFRLPKLSTGVFTVGEALYWDATNNRLTDVSTDNTLVGTAFEAAANPSATGLVRLRA